VPNSDLQLDFNVSVRDSFDAASSAGLRELDESDRFVQKSAESTPMWPSWRMLKFGQDRPNRWLNTAQPGATSRVA
jgi:hypothetical protein